MRTALETVQTARARLRDVLVGQRVRTADLIAWVAATVAAKGLSACDGATFGLFNQAAGNDVCSITAGLKVLTSPDNPWTAADVGKTVDIAGAGAAGAVHRTVIAGFTSAGSVTVRDAAVTTVAASVTSAGGLAIWGYPPALALRSQTLMDVAGSALHSLDPAVPGGAGRAVGTALGQRVNVLDFLAVGNGVADDTGPFAAAIDRAILVGGHVYVPAGTYLLATWVMKTTAAPVAICGDGYTKSIIVGPDTGTRFLLVRDEIECEGVCFHTWMAAIYGRPAAAAVAPVGVHRVERCRFTASVRGVELEGAAGDHADSGVRRLVIRGNYFDTLSGSGVTAYYKRIDDATISDNSFFDLSGAGVVQAIYCGNNAVVPAKRRLFRVEHNNIQGVVTTAAAECQAIMIHEADACDVSHNQITTMNNGAATGEDCEAIYIRTVGKAVVHKNICKNIKSYDGVITVKDSCGHAEVTGNVVDNTAYAAHNCAAIMNFSPGAVIRDNHVKSIGGIAINYIDTTFADAPAAISGNVIVGVAGFCAVFAAIGQSAAICDNSVDGVTATNTTNPQFGVVADASPSGICIEVTASRGFMRLSGNTLIVSGGATAIGINQSAGGITRTIVANNIIYAGGKAIRFARLDNSLVVNNTGLAGTGLTVDAGAGNTVAAAWV